MKIPRLLFFHAALVLAGWGIVAALDPRPVTAEVMASTRPSVRDERARREGEEILRQMEAALPVPDPPDPVSPEEGTYEERLKEFAELEYSQPPDEPVSREIAVLFADHKISGIVHGEDGPDLSYAFFHQRVNAREILDLLSGRFPEHGKDHALNEALFRLIAPFDPLRAEELLNPLSPADRDSAFERLDFTAVGGAHPEMWREIADLNSASSDPEWVTRRAEFWEGEAESHLATFGDSYPPWVLDLPPGADRDAAISATAAKLKEIDPAVAARFLKSAEASPAEHR